MRDAFRDELVAQARIDERVVLLMGDIGNRMYDGFQAEFPGRFFNCGVAEANLVGMAAGMAMAGLRPFAYTIVPFLTTRALEQIRVDCCYHAQPVVLAGVGGGLSYAGLGATHHSCEDIAFLRVLPGMNVLCPGDAREVRGAVRAAMQSTGPVYIRLGKKGEPVIHRDIPEMKLGGSIPMRDGKEVAVLSVGNVLPLALELVGELEARGLSPRLDSFYSVKPLDERLLAELFETMRVVAVIEEHSRLGGAGSAIAEWAMDRPRSSTRLLRFGTADEFLHGAGDQSYARAAYGLTREKIANSIVGALSD